MKKLVLSLSINDNTHKFEIEDKFNDLTLGEASATIGFLSSILHSYQHIHGEKQNEYVRKYGKTN